MKCFYVKLQREGAGHNTPANNMIEYTAQIEEAMFYIILFSVSLLVLGFYAFYRKVLVPLIEKRNNIKTEMRFSRGSEHAYWKKELKRFYISCIPVIGKIISRRMR